MDCISRVKTVSISQSDFKKHFTGLMLSYHYKTWCMFVYGLYYSIYLGTEGIVCKRCLKPTDLHLWFYLLLCSYWYVICLTGHLNPKLSTTNRFIKKCVLNGPVELELRGQIFWKHVSMKMVKTDKLNDKKQNKMQWYLSLFIEFYWSFTKCRRLYVFLMTAESLGVYWSIVRPTSLELLN